MKWITAIATTLLIACQAQADLSEAEIAAKELSPPSTAQMLERKENCVIDLSQSEVFEPLAHLEARIHQLPRTEMIVTTLMVTNANGNASIRSLPPAPNGGIGKVHYCNIMSFKIIAPPKNGAYIDLGIALRLRSDIDFEATYPSTWPTMNTQGMIGSFPSARFVVIPEAILDKSEDILSEILARDELEKSGFYLSIDGHVYFSLKMTEQN